jgi:hypothetical protein
MADEIMVIDESAITEGNSSVNFNIPRGYICTVDISTIEGKLSVMDALNGADSLSKHMNEVLIVKDIITTAGTRAVSGTPCTNTHLILADGTTLFSQSDGVKRSVETLVALFTKQDGTCDFGDGIKLQCVEQTLRNGNTIKQLVSVK